MNFAEILAELIKHYDSVNDLYDVTSNWFNVTGNFSCIYQESPDGDRDYSEYTEKVFKVFLFEDHDIYVKVSGEYDSYGGYSFGGWKSVTETKPEEKTITVYN